MALALMIAGVVAVVAGLLTIVWGISLKEFSLGSTLITSGTIGVCSGMLLLGLFVVMQELKAMVRRLAGSTAPSDVRVRPVLPPGIATAGMPAPELGKAEDIKIEAASLSPGTPPPWQGEAAARVRTEAAPPPPVPDTPAPPPPAEPPRRRNLLFESTSRKERERAEAKTADTPSGAEPRPAPPPPAVPPEPPPASFDDAWPKPDRARPLEASVTRRPPPPLRSPVVEPAAASPAPPAPEPPRPAPPAEQAAVTVLKSGVVDGMAYSLYSDGSIEAQMPEGMMRFASIDELRAHLDQRA